jgi:hypothetical protein
MWANWFDRKTKVPTISYGQLLPSYGQSPRSEGVMW